MSMFLAGSPSRARRRLLVLAAITMAVVWPVGGQDDMSASSGEAPGNDSSSEASMRIDMLLTHGFLVFFMQAGFVALESGHGRAKNVRNICLKNVVDVLLCALCWWTVGYGFAYGDTTGGFIGHSNFAPSGEKTNLGALDTDGSQLPKPWFFTFTFALSCITIASGCLAERTQLVAYPLYTVIVSTIVHPVGAHWVWNKGTWMADVYGGCKFLDFAGGTAVHVVGGLVGLVGAIVCGPRIGRFEEGCVKEIPGHDMASVSMGTFMLWFGWFGFNCGSAYLYMGSPEPTVNRVALNMTLTAACGGCTALVAEAFRHGTFDLRTCCNGLLTGLVTGTASLGFITPWASCVAGVMAGAMYVGLSMLLIKLRIDDPLDSSVVHLGGGALGTLLLGVLARPQYVKSLTGTQCAGFVYGGGSRAGVQLGLQTMGLMVISAWTLAFAIPLFLTLKAMRALRVDQATELAGIDNIEHGGPAYPEFINYGSSVSGMRER